MWNHHRWRAAIFIGKHNRVFPFAVSIRYNVGKEIELLP
jgi:hypothetical protein